MTTTRRIRRLAAAATAVLAVAAGALTTASAAVAGGAPGLSAGQGCAAGCITRAAVTTTTTTARVDLATSVSAHLRVTIAEKTAGGGIGGLSADTSKSVVLSAFSATRVAWFAGLKVGTEYTISVRATDLEGRTEIREGTFSTRGVKVAVDTPATGLSSGLGCSAECIDHAVFVQPNPNWSTVNYGIQTNVDARISLTVSLDAPTPGADGPVQHDVVYQLSSASLRRSLADQIHDLRPGTTYHAVVVATDADGRRSVKQGTFTTVAATATITIHKIRVVADGDKVGKGELYFRTYLDDAERFSYGFRRIGSGSVVTARSNGSSRPQQLFVQLSGHGTTRLAVAAEECDAVLMKNCVVEVGPAGGAWATADLDLAALASQPAQGTPWAGTGVAAPFGHDAYLVLDSGSGHVRIQALVTVDVEFHWPS